MEREIRAKLIELARMKTAWSYSNLNEQLLLYLNLRDPQDRKLIGEYIGEISWSENSKGRPLLSALIVHKTDGKTTEAGDGFYKLCAELNGRDWRDLKEDPDFIKKKMRECYDFWKDEKNYRKYKNDY